MSAPGPSGRLETAKQGMTQESPPASRGSGFAPKGERKQTFGSSRGDVPIVVLQGLAEDDGFGGDPVPEGTHGTTPPWRAVE